MEFNEITYSSLTVEARLIRARSSSALLVIYTVSSAYHTLLISMLFIVILSSISVNAFLKSSSEIVLRGPSTLCKAQEISVRNE